MELNCENEIECAQFVIIVNVSSASFLTSAAKFNSNITNRKSQSKWQNTVAHWNLRSFPFVVANTQN